MLDLARGRIRELREAPWSTWMSWIRTTLGDISSGRVLDVATGQGRFIEDLRFELFVCCTT